MRIKPLHSNILVRLEEDKETYKGTLILPSSVTESLKGNSIYGEVMAIGPGKRGPTPKKRKIRYKMADLELGDRIVLHKYAGYKLYIDMKPYIMVDISEVLGILPY